MDQKVAVIIVAILILSVLFLASPKGKSFLEQSKIKDKISIIGNWLKNITGKLPATKKTETNKIEFHLTSVDPIYMNEQQFYLQGSSLQADMKVEAATLSGLTLSFKDDTELSTNSMTGNLIFTDKKIKINGKANEIWLGTIGINKTDTEISILGTPTKFYVQNVEKSSLVFKEVSGSLSWTGIKVPPTLNKDKLEAYDFTGSIELKNGLIYINGYVSYIKLNNIPIGTSK